VRDTSIQPSTRRLLAFALDALQDVLPERILDVGLGFGRWGMLAREICDYRQGRVRREDWCTHVEAVTLTPREVQEYHHFFYDRVYLTDPVEFVETATARWDLVVIEDVLCDLPVTMRRRLLTASLARADYVLVLAPLAMEGGGGGVRALAASELLTLHPRRHALETTDDGQERGSFLLSRADPRGLQKPSTALPVFSRIFQDNLWLERESRSGPGASLVQTATIRREIPTLLASLDIRSLLDAPCGDFNWMRHVDLGVERYIGVDVVPEMIARNQVQFASATRRFLTLDATMDLLPRVDLVLCRDGLVHMSFEDAFHSIANFRRSGSSYLLTTTFPSRGWNRPADTGRWRPLNLQLAPFLFPEPITIINEGCSEENGRYLDKSLALWRLDDLMGKSQT
jgi:SAM-dependent methyltransferase